MIFLIVGIVSALMCILGVISTITSFRSMLKNPEKDRIEKWIETQDFFHGQASNELFENINILEKKGSNLPEKYRNILAVLRKTDKAPKDHLRALEELENCEKEILSTLGDEKKVTWHNAKSFISFVEWEHLNSRINSVKVAILRAIQYLLIAIIAFALYLQR